VVQLISTEILPYANFIPKEFVGQIMTMLNKGSIHSQSSSFTGMVPKWQKIRCLNLLESNENVESTFSDKDLKFYGMYSV